MQHVTTDALEATRVKRHPNGLSLQGMTYKASKTGECAITKLPIAIGDLVCDLVLVGGDPSRLVKALGIARDVISRTATDAHGFDVRSGWAGRGRLSQQRAFQYMEKGWTLHFMRVTDITRARNESTIVTHAWWREGSKVRRMTYRGGEPIGLPVTPVKLIKTFKLCSIKQAANWLRPDGVGFWRVTRTNTEAL